MTVFCSHDSGGPSRFFCGQGHVSEIIAVPELVDFIHAVFGGGGPIAEGQELVRQDIGQVERDTGAYRCHLLYFTVFVVGSRLFL